MSGRLTLSERSESKGSTRAKVLLALTCLVLIAGALVWWKFLRLSPLPEPGAFDRADNGLWMRRHWIHGGAPDEERAELAASLEAHGIRRIHPFLGPMDPDGKPGWRDDGVIRHYDPVRARAFFDEMHRLSPRLKIVPWTGGNLHQDVHLIDAKQRSGFAAHMAAIVNLGADGVQLNVEPMPSGSEGYLDLLRAVKSAIGPDKILSIAAYPPTTPLHPYEDVHWTLAFTAEVCAIADEMTFMGYDTAQRLPALYENMVATWTADLARTLPPHCEWSMGVPAYEDDEPWHRPDVETIGHGIDGVRRGLLAHGSVPPKFTGIAIYASWTIDDDEWAAFDRQWRGVDAVTVPAPDRLPRTPTSP